MSGDTSITITLSANDHARFDALLRLVGVGNAADLITDALQVYEWVVQQTLAGATFTVNGEPVEILGQEKAA